MGGKRLKAKPKQSRPGTARPSTKHHRSGTNRPGVQEEIDDRPIIALPPDVRLDPSRTAPDHDISMRALFADLLNREALIKFIVISLAIIGVPMGMSQLAERYNWSIELWGVGSVMLINVFIGIYLFVAFLEEQRDWKEVQRKKGSKKTD